MNSKDQDHLAVAPEAARADRELLELAAKAAGYRIVWIGWMEDPSMRVTLDGVAWSNWNPLKDDGDALRLAVALDLQIRQVHFAAHAGWPDQFWETERHDHDKHAATRRAIVRAAAAIGEQK